jgi:hypothetical protein
VPLRFFGSGFDLGDVLRYKPDVMIDRPTEMTLGGTRISLLPAQSGETDDAMFIHLPADGVLFVGDALMPYFGAPFVEEGSVDGLLAAIDQIDGLAPRVLVHGHDPLTRIFNGTTMLQNLRTQLGWLRAEVLGAMERGTPRAEIIQSNLIPPTLRASPSSVQLAYLVMRDNAIDRLFDERSGYWQSGLVGLDALGDADQGAALVDYLELGEGELVGAARHMEADGRHELAASLLRAARARLPGSDRLRAEQRVVYLKLMEKYQAFDPFKFFIYSGQIDQNIKQMNPLGGTTPASTAASVGRLSANKKIPEMK